MKVTKLVILTLLAMFISSNIAACAVSRRVDPTGRVLSTATPFDLKQFTDTPIPPHNQETPDVDPSAITTPRIKIMSFEGCPPTPFPPELVAPEGTPAGSGFLVDGGYPSAFYMRLFNPSGWVWFQRRGYFEDVFVYPGYDLENPDQGVIIVTRHKPNAKSSETWIDTPTKAGYLDIVSAERDCLLVVSEKGETFHFDVHGEMFVDSCDEVVPTVTAIPTRPTASLMPELLSDDVPDGPSLVFNFNREINTVLNFYIQSPADEDWFKFYLDRTSNLEVLLEHPGRMFGLNVYRFDGKLEEWKYESLNQSTRLIKIDNAYPCFYYVRVASLDGSYDNVIPYQLEFNTE